MNTMNRKLKLIGLAAVSAVAIGAVGAIAAQAVEFHSEVKETFSLGSQATQHVMTVNGGSIKCKEATFAGNGVGTEKSASNFTKTTVTTHPTYSGCTAFGQSVTITTTGCNLQSDQPTAELTATVAIVCEAGKSIIVSVKAAGCTLTVPAQTKKSRVKFKNEGAGSSRDLLVTSEVEKLVYVSSGGVCGSSGENGKYTGTATTRGFSNAGYTTQIGVWVE